MDSAAQDDSSENNSAGEADRTLVQACQLGDRDAQSRLYEQNVSKIFRLMVRMVGRQDADDLTQQVFLQAFRKIQQFSGRSKFGTWLYRVAVNEALQHRRRHGSRPSEPLLHEPASQTSNRIASETKEALDHALSRIEPDLRAIFLLREVDQLTYAELAEVLNVPAGTVGSRLNRARRELRAELDQLNDL